MTGLIVITRPPDQARPIADALAARGYATLIEPMLRIVPLAATLPPRSAYRALAFTSANGVQAFADLSPERELPAFAVGEATAAALRERGFRDVRVARGDAVALADLIQEAVHAGETVLHVSGRAIAKDLGDLLAPAGIGVPRVALYDAEPARTLSPELVSALYARTLDCVLFFSARTAHIFGTLVKERGFDSMVTSATALCLSEAVAAEARALPWRTIAVAARPTVDSLLAFLPDAARSGKDGQ